MKVCENICQLKIDFNVTPEVKRYVYVYIIVGKNGCYLIDTGVKGSDKKIQEYIHKVGKNRENINAILLTHSHPDHMGAAKDLKNENRCCVYASKGECRWIEDIDLQYKERPIPGFYDLIGGSVRVDRVASDGDTICLEPGVTLDVYETSGHSQESLSFFYQERKVLFTGDAIPAPGDALIYEDSFASQRTLQRLHAMKGIDIYCPAWDRVYGSDEGKAAIQWGLAQIGRVRECVEIYGRSNREYTQKSIEDIFTEICEKSGMLGYRDNPMFKRSVMTELMRGENR